jgi:UDP-N-acetylmuramate--alanine ligase
MKALAELLVDRGWTITGSDLQLSTSAAAWFAKRGLHVHRGHDAGFFPDKVDCLVYSPAVSDQNPERQQAARLGVPQFTYPEMLGRLMQGHVGVCIAGTHGKSTTTAMVGVALTAAGLQPSVVCGAELCDLGVSGWSGDGPWFVVESCEYQRHFLDLSPRDGVILSIESDHFDCFPDLDQTIAAFSQFASRLPASGRLLLPASGIGMEPVRAACSAGVETFSVDGSADWVGTDLRPARDGFRFRLFHAGEYVTELTLRVPGRHNVANAVAAAAQALSLGADVPSVRDALADFSGIRRRLEAKGMWRGATRYDDYAHHPTAVKAVLAAIRERHPGQRVWCVFQPHQISRTRALLDQFVESFSDADDVIVTPVFAARENVTREPAEVSTELAARISATGTPARFVRSLDRVSSVLDDDLSPGDILITMGAGDIGRIHDEYTRRLQRNSAPR